MPQLIEQLIQQELQLIQLPLSFSSFTAPLIFELELYGALTGLTLEGSWGESH
jgi:hypothetical protein